MKKLILFFIFFITIFSSCSSNDFEQNEASNARISAVKNEDNIEIQKLKYSMLTKTEKLTLWSEKLEEISLNKKLSSEQLSLLNDLKSNLDVTVFDKNNNDKKEVFKNIYVANFLKKAKKVFSSEYIYKFFYTFNGKFADDTNYCTCSAGAIFTCGIGVDCGSSSCKVLSDGCGFLGLYECDGRCKL